MAHGRPEVSIVKRALGGMLLPDKPARKKDSGKSILFADEDASQAVSYAVNSAAHGGLSDAALGRSVLTGVGALFLLFLLWVNSYPFIDDELAIHAWLPDPQWALLFCAAWGLCFVGGLMAYTLYHLRPYL